MKSNSEFSVPHHAGFTLVELLISLALLGILLTAVVSVNIGISRSAANLQTRNDLTPELQVAQNYMASKLAQAAYIFPVNTSIQMTASGNTSTKPGGGTNWTIGIDPIVAFVAPPRNPVAGGCAAATSTSTTNTYADRCYAFYAFYAMNRGDYVAAVSGTDDPGSDSANDANAWVLVEYRGYYNDPANNTNLGYLAANASIPTGNKGRLLMDYVAPSPTASIKPLFAFAGTTNNKLTETPGVTSVTINLAAQQIMAGQTVRVPGINTTDASTLTVYPRNVGKPDLSN